VLCHLARRADNKRVAFPGIRAIPKTCRVNCATVIHAIGELKQAGFIITQKMPGRPTTYHLFPEPQAGSEVVSKTTQAEAESVTCLGNSYETKVLPT
jgi:DNA-binding transcriptional regulator YhcF (GntR family)